VAGADPDPFADPPLTAPVEALDVFVSLLSEIEAAEPADDFYSRLCEATCRLTAMRRAVIFLYDEAQGEVRAVGARGIDLGMFEGMPLSPATAEITRRSLEEDRVVEVSELLERELPAHLLPLLEDGLLTCTPMSAGGRWLGVILADRAPEGGPLTAAQRHTLWTLGKTCALAASARIATRQRDRAQQLSERLDLARDVHDRVVQRLFGVSLALSAESLGAEGRERCRQEIRLALTDLREAMQRAPEGRTRRGASLAAELARLREREPALVVEECEGAPPALEPLAVAVLAEAARNARKHAEPKRIEVRGGRRDGAFVLEVVNDGVPVPSRRGPPGMGLRLAAFEALGHGGIVEFGPHGDGRWRVRLAVPLEEPGA
jgi:signal transduction histidine kinase